MHFLLCPTKVVGSFVNVARADGGFPQRLLDKGVENPTENVSVGFAIWRFSRPTLLLTNAKFVVMFWKLLIFFAMNFEVQACGPLKSIEGIQAKAKKPS